MPIDILPGHRADVRFEKTGDDRNQHQTGIKERKRIESKRKMPAGDYDPADENGAFA